MQQHTRTFAVDLDGTIARRNTAALIAKCSSYFKLPEPERLESLSWQAWQALPEVRAYRARVGERAYQRNLAAVALDPAYQRAMLLVEGAVEGVRTLAAHGDIVYATARKTTFSDEWNAKMSQATRDWLAQYAFPSADQVLFCTSPEEKVQALIERIALGETIILIDDLYPRLAAHLASLPSDANWRSSFTLAAFGAQEAPGGLPLPSWREVDTFLESVDLFRRKEQTLVAYSESRGPAGARPG